MHIWWIRFTLRSIILCPFCRIILLAFVKDSSSCWLHLIYSENNSSHLSSTAIILCPVTDIFADRRLLCVIWFHKRWTYWLTKTISLCPSIQNYEEWLNWSDVQWQTHWTKSTGICDVIPFRMTMANKHNLSCVHRDMKTETMERRRRRKKRRQRWWGDFGFNFPFPTLCLFPSLLLLVMS